MNIIEPGLKLIPNVTKLIHCDGCDTTWPTAEGGATWMNFRELTSRSI